MCDPLTIAGMALTLGSTFMSSMASNKVENARSAALVSETQRQDRLQQEAIGNLQGTQEAFTPERQSAGIEAAAQERIERLQRNVTGGAEGTATVADIPLTRSAPNIVRENAARELNKGLGEGKDFAKRLGRLGAFGENQFQNRIDLSRLAEKMGMTGAESRGSANILPLELQSANRAGDSLTGLADILGGAGSAANLGGAVGFNPFSSPVPGTVYTPQIKQLFA